MNILPMARTSELVMQNLNGEVLVYDLRTDKAFNLNETSGIVFNNCDGKTSFAELKQHFKLTDEIIFLALDELKRENLLEENADYSSPFAGISRRAAIKKVGLASMIALPLIVGITAPTAADAASGVVACASVGTQCVCTTGSNNNPNNTCGSGSATFGFAACPAGCSCYSSGVCTSNPGCLGNCQ